MEAAKKENARLREINEVANKERQLSELNKTYKFNLATELDYVKDMDQLQFNKHIELIKNNYQELPLGIVPTPSKGEAIQFGKQEMEKVVKMSQELGITFEDAKKKFIEDNS